MDFGAWATIIILMLAFASCVLYKANRPTGGGEDLSQYDDPVSFYD